VKLLTLVVKPHLLADVVAAAMEAGAGGATVTEVKGFGRQGGHSESYRGTEYRIELVPKSCVEVVVADDMVEAVLAATTAAARTGRIGDGKAWFRRVNDVVRVRTGETGRDAV
jgi:nitrogen regulatory protein P-II 1